MALAPLRSRLCFLLLACSHLVSCIENLSRAEPIEDGAPQNLFVANANHDQVPLQAPHAAKRVAIIGAGAAGSSAAYHLRQYADAAGMPVDISVFERNAYIGGRSTTVYAFQDQSETPGSEPAIDAERVPIELGASIFVSVNHILVDAVETFNLSLTTDSPPATRGKRETETLGIWDGERLVYTQQMGGGKLREWWSTAKILWRYGLSPVRTMRLMNSVVGKFLKMYEEPVFPWTGGLTEAIVSVGLLDATASTGSQFVWQAGISAPFANDIIQASTRVNYAQNLGAIHGVEAMVCMAASGAMSVEGGNWRIFAKMLNASGADIYLNTSIDRAGAKDASLTTLHPSNKPPTDFDAVILAAPYHQAGIKFHTPPAHVPGDIDYVELHVTLFSSPHSLSPLAFNVTPGDTTPDVILTTLPGNKLSHGPGERSAVGPAHFFSISTLRTAMNHRVHPPREENLYKIFSAEPVNASFINHILGLQATGVGGDTLDEDAVPWIYRKVWKSYPYLPPRVTFEPQKLDGNLWYTGGIESFISTMETSSLSGRNVARLVVDGWLEEGAR